MEMLAGVFGKGTRQSVIYHDLDPRIWRPPSNRTARRNRSFRRPARAFPYSSAGRRADERHVQMDVALLNGADTTAVGAHDRRLFELALGDMASSDLAANAGGLNTRNHRPVLDIAAPARRCAAPIEVAQMVMSRMPIRATSCMTMLIT